MQQLQRMKKYIVSQRRSDLGVYMVRRSSSQRPSMDECLTPDDVLEMKKNFQNLKIILSIWAVSKTSYSLSVPNVLRGRTARFAFRIRNWKRRIRATDIWLNTWKWPTTASEVWPYNLYYEKDINHFNSTGWAYSTPEQKLAVGFVSVRQRRCPKS